MNYLFRSIIDGPTRLRIDVSRRAVRRVYVVRGRKLLPVLYRVVDLSGRPPALLHLIFPFLGRFCIAKRPSTFILISALSCAPTKANLPDLSLYSFRHLGTLVLVVRRHPRNRSTISWVTGRGRAVHAGLRSVRGRVPGRRRFSLNAWIERGLAMVAKIH